MSKSSPPPLDPSLDAPELVARAVRYFGRRLGVSCSFGGAGGMVLLDMAVRVDPGVDVFVLDTDLLFPDTYRLIDRVEQRYGIRIRRVRPALSPDEQAGRHGPELWKRDPGLCCTLRKVEPMRDAVRGLDAWITAIRRDQSSTRKQTETISWDEQFGLWKLCPLAGWTEEQVLDYVSRNDVPINPMLYEGYTSIGCTHCTTRPSSDDPRSGRWAGFAKTECGLHAPKVVANLKPESK